jgi:hypothetical protein
LGNKSKNTIEGEILPLVNNSKKERLIKKARKLLETDTIKYSDEEIQALLYHVDKLANIIIDSYITSKEKEL